MTRRIKVPHSTKERFFVITLFSPSLVRRGFWRKSYPHHIYQLLKWRFSHKKNFRLGITRLQTKSVQKLFLFDHVKWLHFFLSSYFHWLSLRWYRSKSIGDPGHSWESKFLERRIWRFFSVQILGSKNLASHECPRPDTLATILAQWPPKKIEAQKKTQPFNRRVASLLTQK